jgi:RNA polymerase sigma-70 factor, ECF subfamily
MKRVSTDLDIDVAMRRHRRELHVYCYRMLGSFDEAEDHVQEVFLRAWRSRDSFNGRASSRAWLYKIATNACLDTLRRNRRRPAVDSNRPSVAAMPWIQPYPDALLDELASDQPGPEMQAITRESISLAYLVALQLLPPRQRAVLILRDVLDLSANQVADLVDTSVPAVKSALQRARATLHEHHAHGATGSTPPTSEQRRLLQRYIAAHEQADAEAVIALLREDIRLAISPQVGEWNGRDQVGAALRSGMNSLGAWRVLATTANGHPATAGYLRRPNEATFLPFVFGVLVIEGSEITDIAAFEMPNLITAFGLPAYL